MPVESWIGHRGKTHLDAQFFTEVEEGSTCELSVVVRDDSVGYSEEVHNPFNELDGGLGHLMWYWHHFHPLCELVNSHEEVFMSPDRLRYLAHNVQPPDRERPRDWNWL